jgi:L-fuconolactonase
MGIGRTTRFKTMHSQVIDSHQHFWQPGLFDYPWMSPEVAILYRDYLPHHLEPIIREQQVSGTVLVQASNSVEETRWMLELADQHPFIFGVVGWVDLASERVEEQLIHFLDHPKFKGVRHLVESEPDKDWLIQPHVLRGLKVLSRHKVPYDMLVHPEHLENVSRVADQCPDLDLVIDHLAKPRIAKGEVSAWALDLRRVAANPNVHCKLSGLVTEADHESWTLDDLRPFVESALEIFGPSRLIFGSDYPVCLLAASYPRVLNTARLLLDGLSNEEKSRIFFGNAVAFYRLNSQVFAA